MLGMPAPTRYDWNFRLLGIPVRVNPLFWLITLVLGFNSVQRGEIWPLMIWIACVFASILLHEFGHGLTAKAFGYRPMIALYGMGGLCASESERQTPGERLAVLIAGPGSQFLLLGAVCLFGWLALGISWRGDIVQAKLLFGQISGHDWLGKFEQMSRMDRAGAIEHDFAAFSKPMLFRIFSSLFFINLIWPLLNLLPIYPLDGGQIAQVLMTKADWRNGPRRVHIVSMVTAGVIAAFVLIRSSQSDDPQGGLFMVFFFGGFAFLNYQMLQAYHQGYVSPERDDSDWWKR